MHIFEAVKGLPLEGVLTRYGIKIYHHKIVCPYHADKHPSMQIYKDHAYCFVCGKAADATNLMAQFWGVSQYEAAKKIAGDYGLQVEESKPLTAEKKKAIEFKMEQEKAMDAVYNTVVDRLNIYLRTLTFWENNYSNLPCMNAILPYGRYYMSLKYLPYFAILCEEAEIILDETIKKRYTWARDLKNDKRLIEICREVRKTGELI